MTTKFEFLYPWFRWKTEDHNGEIDVFRGMGFPTEISYHSYFGETHFEFMILGFGFSVERYPEKGTLE